MNGNFLIPSELKKWYDLSFRDKVAPTKEVYK